MPQLALVSSAQAVGRPAAQAAHDLRNLLTTIGLHLETLQRLSGPTGAKAADAAYALLTRGTTLCNDMLERAASMDARARRRGVDPIVLAQQIADLLASTAPEGFAFAIERSGPVAALADPDDLFRILFNLMNNAVAVARSAPLRTVTIGAAVEDRTIAIRIADDGPGLPARVRSDLFGARARRLQQNGYGLAIARELAERNGGTLTLTPGAKGTAFVLRVPALLSVPAVEGPVTRSLGRRISP
jgi:signal transduction histidine kinase